MPRNTKPPKKKKKLKKVVEKGKCRFTKARVEAIDYKDVATLQKMVSAQGKLYGRKRTGTMAHFQRKLQAAVKRARFLALLPFVARHFAAMRDLGLTTAMLSFVEKEEDVAELVAELPGAEPMLKVESRRGLAFAGRHGARLGRLVAARGDLFVEVREPHRLVGALRDVIAADPDAVAASRLFPTLSRTPVPVASEVCDAAFLLALGYRTFLLGDEVCLRREPVLAALDLLAAVAREMA